MLRTTTVSLLCLFLTGASPTAADAPPPRSSYALHLEARPSAVFPFLDNLGRVEIEVYPQGVRADSLWLDGFLESGTQTVRIENPAIRLYSDASFSTLQKLFASLKPDRIEELELGKLPVAATGREGKVKKIPVQCYRISLGETAWIDVWTTRAFAANPAWEALQQEVLKAVSPELAIAAKQIPGITMHVVLNTERFPETTLLTTREVFLSSAGHEEALRTGRFFLEAPSLDKLVK